MTSTLAGCTVDDTEINAANDSIAELETQSEADQNRIAELVSEAEADEAIYLKIVLQYRPCDTFLSVNRSE